MTIPAANGDRDLCHGPANHHLVECLENLDDVIFPAIDGDLEALNAAGPAWRAAVAEVGAEAIQETRCEYLRHAKSVWQFLVRQSVQQPLRLMAVMKIIGLLLGDDV
jgi:hypothetical protein